MTRDTLDIQSPDYFGLRLDQTTHIVVLTEQATIEDADGVLSNVYPRGLYPFTNYKAARHFTTLVNSGRDDLVAWRYSRNNDETEEKDNDNGQS